MMMNILPRIFLGPFVGPFIDRWNRKKIIICSDLITMLLTILLIVLFYTNTIQVWHVYVVLFCRALSARFQRPAFRTTIPMIVPENQLVRANGLYISFSGVMDVISPLLGALLLESLPMHWVLSVDIITAIVAIVILVFLTIPQPVQTSSTQKLNIIGDMLQGIHYIVSWKALFLLTILVGVLNFFAIPGEMLLPVFVTSLLDGSVLKLGWLATAFGSGVVSGGLILGVWGGFKRQIITVLFGFIIYCIAYFLFGFTTENLFFMGLSLWFIAGFAIATADASVDAILQSTVPQNLQGRVFTVLGSINASMIPIGLIVLGVIADAAGIRMIYHIGGVAMLILLLPVFYFGNLMKFEKNRKENDSYT